MVHLSKTMKCGLDVYQHNKVVEGPSFLFYFVEQQVVEGPK